jgi:DNA-directed RNA polymerase subunit RPC12/RpoP
MERYICLTCGRDFFGDEKTGCSRCGEQRTDWRYKVENPDRARSVLIFSDRLAGSFIRGARDRTGLKW